MRTIASLFAASLLMLGLGAATAASASAAPAEVASVTASVQAGGSGTFYYGPLNTSTVCGFYGQATNYNYGSGQQYHWAFKSLDAGYTTVSVQFSGTGGKTVATGGKIEGYTTFSSAYKTADHTLIFTVKNGAGVCTAKIYGSNWTG